MTFPSNVCKDESKQCKNLQKMCHLNVVQEKCQKTCGLCPDTSTSSTSTSTTTTTNAKKPPNIVFILADDLGKNLCHGLDIKESPGFIMPYLPPPCNLHANFSGYNDVSWHNPKIITPNLDNLAKSGLILENHYVQPKCTPTRSALMTGYYPIHTGHQVSTYRISNCGNANNSVKCLVYILTLLTFVNLHFSMKSYALKSLEDFIQILH